jgi:hypothetical protein
VTENAIQPTGPTQNEEAIGCFLRDTGNLCERIATLRNHMSNEELHSIATDITVACGFIGGIVLDRLEEKNDQQS